MTKWIIESKAGTVLGVYEGETKKAAFLAMLEDAGDAGAYGAAHVGTETDWIITPSAEWTE